jgi:protein-S-isoprenylcysteine O-methyltransferase Ste14
MEAQIFNYKHDKRKLFLLLLTRFFYVYILIGLLIFLPAGDIKFFNGWLYLITLFIPMICIAVYFFIKDPQLLEKRMRIKEKQKKQKIYVIISLFLFIVTYAIPGFDYRFNWSRVPLWLVVTSIFFIETGYFMFFTVLKQNSFASRIIEVQEGQKVIETGLYSLVRHPMYLAAMIIYLGTPLILGSFYSLFPVLFLPLILSYRIINEEKVLSDNLEGYLNYMKKVKYRLIPFVW